MCVCEVDDGAALMKVKKEKPWKQFNCAKQAWLRVWVCVTFI